MMLTFAFHAAQKSTTPKSQPATEEGEESGRDKGEPGAEPEDGEPITDFHRLLLLRLLRPDRFPIAMAAYVSDNLALDLSQEAELSLDQLSDALNFGMGGVLVLLPSDNDSQRLSKMVMSTPPGECIKKLAEVCQNLNLTSTFWCTCTV